MEIKGVVTGGKVIDEVTGARYWWPDEDQPAEAAALGDGWQDVGYISEDGVTRT